MSQLGWTVGLVTISSLAWVRSWWSGCHSRSSATITSSLSIPLVSMTQKGRILKYSEWLQIGLQQRVCIILASRSAANPQDDPGSEGKFFSVVSFISTGYQITAWLGHCSKICRCLKNSAGRMHWKTSSWPPLCGMKWMRKQDLLEKSNWRTSIGNRWLTATPILDDLISLIR